MGVAPDEARAIALSMPEAVEQDHHGRPSFRVAGKIFATLWNEDRINVMLDEGGILTAVESAPDRCEQVWWGKRLAAVGVTLSRVDPDFPARPLVGCLGAQGAAAAPDRLITSQERRPPLGRRSRIDPET